MEHKGALVLTRRIGEHIQIGEDVLITVLNKYHHGGRQVVLAIQAPREVRVMRYELLRENERAPFAPIEAGS